ncbi:MAG: prephenate dehydrogenase/arogenate dehydrogenase family protein [Actinomycetota bacterium]|nr:prephenate dehydrogenase/arogenate dehydrogenase family protein [Actinomycetota bacterium]
MDNPDLQRLRDEIGEIDRQIVELAARRSELAAMVGEAKRETGAAIRDFSREKEVVGRAREIATGAGLSEDLAEKLMLELIRSSLVVQERDQVRASSAGTGRSALVIGGLGHMGSWFVRFLESQGFAVAVADPSTGDGDYQRWHDADDRFDLYVIATPLPVTAEILSEMAANPPEGLIFDIGSLKTPLRRGLDQLAETGALVTSIHPMFGADTDLLSGRHVVLVDLGNAEATSQARKLFSSTMASIVEMDLDSHDRLIAYILGLSHALNIAFFTALAESGEAAATLAELSSTTFDRQLDVASQVAGENPHLYFEIQYLNQYGGESLAALGAAVDRLRAVVEAGDVAGFSSLMEDGAAYLEETMRR